MAPALAGREALPTTPGVTRAVEQRIFGRSLLLGGLLGGLGGYVGFQLGQRRAQSSCSSPEGCTSDWLLPLSGTIIGAGAGFIFAPGYVAGEAGYRCDMDRRVAAYAGGALGGGLIATLGIFGQDAQALVQGLALPWVLPIWACIGSLEPIEAEETAP
ncbi:MAG: hypothetical protein CMH55_05285 [Myxococcales bacterium]|nr:hypothetical protein [Myxococcales bacterium]